MLGYDKADSGKESEEEEDDERIADGNDEARESIVPKRPTFSTGLVGFDRLGVIGIGSEAEEQDAAQYLEIENSCGALDEVHHETHTQARNHGIDEVAHRRSTARGKAIPASLVEGALYGKHSDGSHRRTCHDSYHHTPYCEVDGVD